MVVLYFIASDMEHGTGKDRNHLIRHLIQKLHYFRIGHIKNFIMYSEFSRHFDLKGRQRIQYRFACEAGTSEDIYTMTPMSGGAGQGGAREKVDWVTMDLTMLVGQKR